MANPKIEVEIGAITDKLVKGVDGSILSLEKLEKEITQLNQQLKTEVDPANIVNLNRRLNELTAGAKQLKSVGIDPLTKATSQYNSVGIDFARIIQDAPFGIIGVGNNITQLAGSFQQLKNQTGSTSQALKSAFASIFSSGNALILGISALTTAFTILQMKGFFKTKEEAGTLTEQLEKYRETLDKVTRSSIEGASNAQREAQSLDLLRRQAENVTIPLQRRIEAVDALQKKYPSYLGNLSKEEILAGKVGSAYSDLTKQIVATSKAEAFANEIRKNTIDIFTLQQQELEKVNQILDARRKLESIQESSRLATGQDLVALKQQEEIQQRRINDLVFAQVESANKRNNIQEENLRLESQINNQISLGAKFTNDTVTNLSNATNEAKNLKRVFEDINKLPSIGLPGDNRFELAERLRARRQELGREKNLVDQTGPEFIANALANVQSQGIITSLPISQFAETANQALESVKVGVQDLSEAFTGLGVIIGSAFKNPQLGTFVGQFAQFVTKIVAGAFAVSKANAIAGATKSSLFSGPAAVFTLPAFIAGAVGLVASAFAGLRGAGGGATGVGTSGISQGTSFTGQSQSVGFDRSLDLRGQFRIDGTDLIYVIDRARESQI